MFKFPYTNLHELNLDWILEKVKTLVANNDEFNEKADYAVETADEAKAIAEQAAQAQIGDGAVTTAKLADGAVTSAKLANNAVYSVNIVDGEVGTSDLAEGAVTTSRILDGAVTGAKIFDGAVTNTKLGNASVTNGKISDGAVSLVKLDSTLRSNIATLLANIVTTQTLLSEETTIAPNGNAWVTAPAVPTGKRALGVAGFQLTGTGITQCYIYAVLANGTVAVHNTWTANAVIQTSITYLLVDDV